MKERGWGRIVNIASIFGLEHGGGPTCMAAKAAVIALTKHFGLGLASQNILVNSVAPGSIQFPGGSWERFVSNNSPQVVQEFIARNLPMGRSGWPEPLGDLAKELGYGSPAPWLARARGGAGGLPLLRPGGPAGRILHQHRRRPVPLPYLGGC